MDLSDRPCLAKLIFYPACNYLTSLQCFADRQNLSGESESCIRDEEALKFGTGHKHINICCFILSILPVKHRAVVLWDACKMNCFCTSGEIFNVRKTSAVNQRAI